MFAARQGEQHDADRQQHGVIFRQQRKSQPKAGLRPDEIWMLEFAVIGQPHDAVGRRKDAQDQRTVGLNPSPETDGEQR